MREQFGITRRRFHRLLAAAVGGIAAVASGCASWFRRREEPGLLPLLTGAPGEGQEGTYEYVIVGSGAGGGTVAARLAEAGRKVLLLEAGGDPRELSGGNPNNPQGDCLPEDYDVPCFHGFSTENDAMKWEFFVRHYADINLQRRDKKYYEVYDGKRVDGVFYPRAGTLGGCTAHNALIMVYPHNKDWDDIAQLTGDSSWNAENMRTYFERIENCHYRPFDRLLSNLGINPARHGWNGWLQTEKAIPKVALKDKNLDEVLLESAREAFEKVGEPTTRLG